MPKGLGLSIVMGSVPLARIYPRAHFSSSRATCDEVATWRSQELLAAPGLAGEYLEGKLKVDEFTHRHRLGGINAAFEKHEAGRLHPRRCLHAGPVAQVFVAEIDPKQNHHVGRRICELYDAAKGAAEDVAALCNSAASLTGSLGLLRKMKYLRVMIKWRLVYNNNRHQTFTTGLGAA
ncbi:hypothetical protein GQ53DRAFT_758889 [Thozetella sp. PMI_491]|nr:hypothetical protein GQ53DRAFT_758889 [Thozetella sp. PMI_491]